MNIIFRVDSSSQIGMGHLMRCLTLAEKMIRNNMNVFFICKDLPGNYNFLIERKEIKVYALTCDSDSHCDAENTLRGCRYLGEADWLVVDNYNLDAKWEKSLRPYVKKIMVIDDLANRYHDCDLLLDQNLFSNMLSRYDKLTSDNCKKLLGPKFALLREQFAVARKEKLRGSIDNVNRVLLSFGGSDNNDFMHLVLRSLLALNIGDLIVDVVVARHAGNFAFRNVNFHCQVDNVAELLSHADLAFGAGGISTWERCCLGVVSLIYSLAENQVQVAQAVDDHFAGIYMGNRVSFDNVQLVREFLYLCENMAVLNDMRNKALQLVDGYGCHRVVDIMKRGIN